MGLQIRLHGCMLKGFVSYTLLNHWSARCRVAELQRLCRAALRWSYPREVAHWLEGVAWRMDLPFGLPGTMTCITQSQFWVASKGFVQF